MLKCCICLAIIVIHRVVWVLGEVVSWVFCQIGLTFIPVNAPSFSHPVFPRNSYLLGYDLSVITRHVLLQTQLTVWLRDYVYSLEMI